MRILSQNNGYVSGSVSMSLDEKIKEANQKLKTGGSLVQVYRRDNRLWLRGNLPPKSHLGKEKDYRLFY